MFNFRIKNNDSEAKNIYERIFELQCKLEEESGSNYEISKTIEELTELSLELQQHLNKGKDNRNEILEEYVDVLMKLLWLPKAFLFSDEEIKKMMTKKCTKIEKKYLKNDKKFD